MHGQYARQTGARSDGHPCDHGERPVVLAVSTNDGLSGSAANLGTLLNRRHYYFVPLRQDAPHSKPRSLVADMTLIPAAIDAAMNGRQLQPILLAPSV